MSNVAPAPRSTPPNAMTRSCNLSPADAAGEPPCISSTTANAAVPAGGSALGSLGAATNAATPPAADSPSVIASAGRAATRSLGTRAARGFIVAFTSTAPTPRVALATACSDAIARSIASVMSSWSFLSVAYRPRSARTAYKSTSGMGNPSSSTSAPRMPGAPPSLLSRALIAAISCSIASRSSYRRVMSARVVAVVSSEETSFETSSGGVENVMTLAGTRAFVVGDARAVMDPTRRRALVR